MQFVLILVIKCQKMNLKLKCIKYCVCMHVHMTKTFWRFFVAFSNCFFGSKAFFIPHFLVYYMKVWKRKMFWLYHVNNHPINNEMITSASVSSRYVFWTIKHKNPFKTLEKKRNLEFLTSWQFPDLPIEFCESNLYVRIRFYVIMQDFVKKYW